MSKRASIVFYIFLGIVIVVLARVTFLMVSSTVEENKRGRSTGNRGMILDRNGNLLAVSYKTFSLWVMGNTLSDHERRVVAKLVEKYLGIPLTESMRKFARNSEFMWIARKVSEDKVESISRVTNEFENLFGKNSLVVEEEYIRRYPIGEKASTVVGAVNVDNEGISGLEHKFNEVLLERNGTTGKLVLTIDKYIQEITYLELARSVKKFEAEVGIALFAKKNGEILSMADFPSFDPNNLSTIPFSSRAVGYIIEPGSVMKLASMSFALMNFPEVGRSIYECDGSIKIYNHVITEHPHNSVSSKDIIAHSCNVGMLKISKHFDEKAFYLFLRSLGFGDKTFVGLPGEEKGILRVFNEWSGVSKYMISIGQEIGVTGIQLLRLGLILANDGVSVYPKLVKEVVLGDGERKTIRYHEGNRVIPTEVCGKIREYMRASVEYGTSKLANIHGIMIGGKTGTGQIYDPRGGYYKDSYNAVFLGIVPYNDPKLVGVIILVNPKKLKQGGMSASPTFRNVLEKILAYNPRIIQTQ